MMAAATEKRVGGTARQAPMVARATPASWTPSMRPLSALVTDISMAVSTVPSMGLTMKGIAAMPATVGIALATSAPTEASRCAAATATAGGVHDAADERSGPEHGGEHLPGEGVEGDDGTTLGFVVLICWFDEGGGTGQSEVAGFFLAI